MSRLLTAMILVLFVAYPLPALSDDVDRDTAYAKLIIDSRGVRWEAQRGGWNGSKMVHRFDKKKLEHLLKAAEDFAQRYQGETFSYNTYWNRVDSVQKVDVDAQMKAYIAEIKAAMEEPDRVFRIRPHLFWRGIERMELEAVMDMNYRRK